jgi:hypothetical protein
MTSITRRYLLQRFVFLLLTSASVTVFAQQEEQALERLENVAVFAFGGVGYAGTTSKGELAFRILMHQAKEVSLTQLSKLYTDGNPQAKAYALAGLHKLDRERFNQFSATLPNSTVKIESGCLVSTEPLASIAKEIASGAFDKQIG